MTLLNLYRCFENPEILTGTEDDTGKPSFAHSLPERSAWEPPGVCQVVGGTCAETTRSTPAAERAELAARCRGRARVRGSWACREDTWPSSVSGWGTRGAGVQGSALCGKVSDAVHVL